VLVNRMHMYTYIYDWLWTLCRIYYSTQQQTKMDCSIMAEFMKNPFFHRSAMYSPLSFWYSSERWAADCITPRSGITIVSL
jgi:hypothetical protein